MNDRFSILSLLALLCGIAIHGLGHMLAARAVGVRMIGVHRTPTGLRLMSDASFPSYDAELYCALGGPIANVTAALLGRLVLLPFGAAAEFVTSFIPFSLFLGLLNLLPLQGFDGARILFCLLCTRHRHLASLDPFTAQRVIRVISCSLLVFLWLLSVYVLLRRGSALSLYVFCLQLFRSVALERPRKSSIQEHSGGFASIREHEREYRK